MKWSICIPSIPSRRVVRRRLLAILEPQIDGYEDIELLILEDNLKRDYGSKLQAMIGIANGEYISFVDDDDLVAHNYIDTIYPLLNGVDCVGFTGHISINESQVKQVKYSIKNKEPLETDECFFRYVQQINPIRTELVRKAEYSGHFGADIAWTEKAIQMNLLKTENYIKEIMYIYLASTFDLREGVWE